jgi:anaerobic selenocysteine-containing dehydrogenase
MSDPKSEMLSTACNLCFVNCGIKVQLGGDDGRQILKVMGDKEHPASEGYICNKATRINYYQNYTGRLTSPMRRRDDGTYEAIDWDTAISEIASKLAEIKNTHGGERITFYGGGGQGNHLCGAYGKSLMGALDIKYRSGALAQEKTGLAWVMGRVIGGPVFWDIEEADVIMFAGKNPFMSNGIDRGRAFLREVKKDPNKTLIVLDPRRSETTDFADIHLQVKPGRDAWALSAILAHIIQNHDLPMAWLSQHTHGFEEVIDTFSKIPVSRFAEFSGIAIDQVAQTAELIVNAKGFALEEDIGIQMAPHSTLISYLNLITMIMNGHYGKPGTLMANTPMVQVLQFEHRPTDQDGNETGMEYTPVTKSPIITGLYPCTAFPDEVLTDHEERFRAAIFMSSNPVHSLPDSKKMREAIRALDFSVAIDPNMTETALECDYVLPACSQYERYEATFFPMRIPDNFFHVRQPLMSPAPGTLPEAEMVARIIEAMQYFDDGELEPLKQAAQQSMGEYRNAFFEAAMTNPKIMKAVSYVLYRTLGPALGDDKEVASVVWGLCQTLTMQFPKEVAAAGYTSDDPGTEMFENLLNSPSGAIITRTAPEDSFTRIPYPEKKLQVAMKEMLEEIDSLHQLQPLVDTSEEYPFALVAGNRRSYTANTILRDPAWIKGKDAFTLTIHPDDADKHGISEGDTVTLETSRGAEQATIGFDDRMHPGTLAIPNGQGLLHKNDDGEVIRPGVFANELTDYKHCDKFAGTPWHKFVPAKITPAREIV